MSSFTVISDVDVAVDGYGFVGFWTAYDKAGIVVAKGRCTVVALTKEAALAAAKRDATTTIAALERHPST